MNLADFINNDDFDLLELGEFTFKSSVFIQLAEKYKLFDSNLSDNVQYTLFIPPDECISDDIRTDSYNFEMFFRRHLAKSIVIVQNNSNIQIKTDSGLIYGLYNLNSDYFICKSRFITFNNSMGQCIIHEISSDLPNLCLIEGDIWKIPLVTLSNQKYEISVKGLDISNVYFDLKFCKFNDRKHIGGQSCEWNINGITVEISIPIVSQEENVNMWLQLIDNVYNVPIVSWIRPQNMIVFPNLNLHVNPEPVDFLPKNGSGNQALWIHGKSFTPSCIRVSIGDKAAVIYTCTDTLIKCITPTHPTGTKCDIQVANGDIFVTLADTFVYK